MTNKRSREDYFDFLRDRLAETKDRTVQVVLATAIDKAEAYDRSVSPAASLARLVEACDAIESGAAAALARRLKQSEGNLKSNRRNINSLAVDAYVRLREADDIAHGLKSEWLGPRGETLRRSGDLKKYLDARRDAQETASAGGTRGSKGSAARRLEEIIGSLPKAEFRQEMRFALEKLLQSKRELDLLRSAIKQNFPTASLDEMIRPASSKSHAKAEDAMRADEVQILAQLRRKLSDNDQLRQFGLNFANNRLKTITTGAHFLSQDEYLALMAAVSRALG